MSSTDLTIDGIDIGARSFGSRFVWFIESRLDAAFRCGLDARCKISSGVSVKHHIWNWVGGYLGLARHSRQCSHLSPKNLHLYGCNPHSTKLTFLY